MPDLFDDLPPGVRFQLQKAAARRRLQYRLLNAVAMCFSAAMLALVIVSQNVSASLPFAKQIRSAFVQILEVLQASHR